MGATKAATGTLAIAATLACAVSASAEAPIGVNDGVVMKRRGVDLVISFHRTAARSFRGFAGRRVRVGCSSLPVRTRDGIRSGTSFAYPRAPRRRRPFAVDGLLDSRRSDYCTIVVRLQADLYVGAPEVTVPLTRRGAVFVDERERAREIAGAVAVASVIAQRRRAKRYPGLSTLRRNGVRAVPLASPEASPPAGRVGYFDDGGDHISAVALSAGGRRLFVELDGDRVNTNVLDYLPKGTTQSFGLDPLH